MIFQENCISSNQPAKHHHHPRVVIVAKNEITFAAIPIMKYSFGALILSDCVAYNSMAWWWYLREHFQFKQQIIEHNKVINESSYFGWVWTLLWLQKFDFNLNVAHEKRLKSSEFGYFPYHKLKLLNELVARLICHLKTIFENKWAKRPQHDTNSIDFLSPKCQSIHTFFFYVQNLIIWENASFFLPKRKKKKNCAMGTKCPAVFIDACRLTKSKADKLIDFVSRVKKVSDRT